MTLKRKIEEIEGVLCLSSREIPSSIPGQNSTTKARRGASATHSFRLVTIHEGWETISSIQYLLNINGNNVHTKEEHCGNV